MTLSQEEFDRITKIPAFTEEELEAKKRARELKLPNYEN